MPFTSLEDRDLQTLGALPPLRSRPAAAAETFGSAAEPVSSDPAPAACRPLCVLLIDPSPLTRECLSRALADGAEEFSVVAAGSPDKARALAPADLVLVHAGGEAI